MPSVIVKSFAQQTGKPESEVEELWNKAKGIVTKQYAIDEPTTTTPDSVKEKYYKLTTGILKRMLGLNEGIFSRKTGRLACDAGTCVNNRDGFCSLPLDSVSINYVYECEKYERK